MWFLVTCFLVLLSSLIPTHAQSCASSATSDVFTPSPTLTLPTPPTTAKIYANCSEKVQLFTQGGWSDIPWTRTNCPHLRTDLVSATPMTAGADVTISVPTLLKACHLPTNNGVINKITIVSGGALILDDADMNIHVREINVAVGGSLLMGSSTCRLYSRIGITFYGTLADSSQRNGDTSKTSKGLISLGLVEMHGKRYHPTWTRLSRSAITTNNLLYLQDLVNWEVGQSVLITTTIHYDCPTQWISSCDNVPHQNEIRTITAITTDSDGKGSVLQLDSPLTNGHYAGTEYQAEVALLSRRIVLKGVQTNDNYGGHVKVQGAQAQGRFSGVQGENMGQLNILGRYPFHFHLMGELPTEHSYMQECSVTNSNFRGYVIHGTNNTRLSRNVAYNVKGMCFYLEDGVEERNTLEYNLAAHIHPIFKPANGPWGQAGDQFVESSDLIIPADTSASGFYIPNAYNNFVGNAASGGWSGFAFPNTPAPLGDFKNTLPATSVYNPERRPLLKFLGNTAHSAGFYWKDHGSCIYVGAKLYYKDNKLNYDSGRHDRDTVNPNGSPSIMIFQQTKAFLCYKGIAHWGNRIHVINAELTDIYNGAMLFGDAMLQNVLINGRTPNGRSGAGNAQISQNKMGFQFYDTWVRTVLSGVTFRNFVKSQGDYVIRYMDHSDQFLPQGINAVTKLKFENVDAEVIVGIDKCGTECGGDGYNTMSSKIYTVWDWDGSLTRTGVPSILGSNKAWWNWAPGCTFRDDMRVYVCPWYPKTTVGYIGITVPTLMTECDRAKSTTCGIQKAGYTVGRVAHWGAAGATNTIDISPWPGVAGLTNTGWYWRPKSTTYGVDGAPSQFQIDGFQLARSHFIVLAVRYPKNAKFTVRMVSNWWNFIPAYSTIPPATTRDIVFTKTETLKPANQINCDTNEWYDFCTTTETGGVGPTWYFDGSYLYIRVVNPMCYNTNTKDQCDDKYSAGGVSIGNIYNAFKYDIQATCQGEDCSVQSTLGPVTYWNIDDTPPSEAFNPDWGTAPSITSGRTPVATAPPFVCSANYIPPTSGPEPTDGPTLAPGTTDKPGTTGRPSQPTGTGTGPSGAAMIQVSVVPMMIAMIVAWIMA